MAEGRILNATRWSFISSLWAARKAFNEEPIQTLWTQIITAWFPSHEPYKLFFKAATLASNDQPDIAVIEIRFFPRYDPNVPTNSLEFREFQIFMVECKGPEEDTPSGWAAAETQLAQYMQDNINGSQKMYGAIGIGTKARFYQWDSTTAGNPDLLIPIHQNTIEIDSPEGRAELETQLDIAKQNGWDLAANSV